MYQNYNKNYEDYDGDEYYDDDDKYYDEDDDEDYDDEDDDDEDDDEDDDDEDELHRTVTVETNIGWKIRNEEVNPKLFAAKLEVTKPDWTIFYTDASRSEYEDYMGLAWISADLGIERKYQVTSDWTSSQGEAMIINIVLEYIYQNKNIKNAVICSDSLGTLEALENLRYNDYADNLIYEMQECVDKLDDQQTVEFWWSPAHLGIEGNEAADKAAESARWFGEYYEYYDNGNNYY